METGLARSTIGMRVARDARFFDRLANGKGFTVKTYDAVVRWFSANWPDKGRMAVRGLATASCRGCPSI